MKLLETGGAFSDNAHLFLRDGKFGIEYLDILEDVY
jgi:hypothetical protein